MSKVNVPSNVLGWQVGDVRNYTFWGCKVEAICRQSSMVECYLLLPNQTVPFIDSPYFDPGYQDIEECAQEWAAEVILEGLRDGKLTVSEVKL